MYVGEERGEKEKKIKKIKRNKTKKVKRTKKAKGGHQVERAYLTKNETHTNRIILKCS